MAPDRSPLISIIVPVYNVSAYLDRTLQTIVGQTHRNLEIILIDDGSSDNSGALCDLWASKDSRIQVIHQENRGPSCARNAGLDVASGDFILFSDSDDLLSPELCQVLLDSMAAEANIAMCDILHIFPDQPYSFEISAQQVLWNAEDVIHQMWYQTGILPSACAKLYRKSIFNTHRFTPGLFFEDIDLLHELFWTAEKIAYTPSQLYGYVHRAGSITTRPFSEKDFDILKVADRLLAFCADKADLVKPAQAYAVTAALRIYLNAPKTPEFSDGIGWAKQVIRRHGKFVLLDSRIRKKSRYALWLYFLCRPLLRVAYKYTNRWK